MTRCAVLLRGVNVGRANRIAMADFRSVLEELGCRDVVTYLQSGNAVVEAPPDGLAQRVERALRERLGLDVRVLVRTGNELAAVVAANPFPELVPEPKRLHVAFLEGQPDEAVVRGIGLRHGDDEFRVGDRVLYLAYAGGTQNSALEKPLRRLAGVSTDRNWTTVTRLASLAVPSQEGGPA